MDQGENDHPPNNPNVVPPQEALPMEMAMGRMQLPAFEFPFNNEPNANDFDEISYSDQKALATFTRNELFIPLQATFLVLVTFWSISIHGSLFIFFMGASLIFYLSTIKSVKEIPGSYPSIATRSDFQMLEIRVIQLFMMYSQLLLIHLISWITSPFNYFQNFDKLREDVLAFFSKIESHHWSSYLTISNQLFWLTLTWIVSARTISNLFVMCRTPSFRSLVRYETETMMTATISIWLGFMGFNSVATNFRGSFPMTMTLLLTLFAWVGFCHLRSTVLKEEHVILRRNNLSGLLRVMTVIMSQLLVGALLTSLLSLVTSVTIQTLSIPTSSSIPEQSLHKYLHSVPTPTNQKFKSVEQGKHQNVVELNLNLLTMITSHVLTTRLLKHRYDINKLDTVLDRVIDFGH